MRDSQATPAGQAYWAFISYRHLDNRQPGREWATWLHQRLENYEIPENFRGQTNGRGDVIPERIYPVFRDEEDLPADADLSSSIQHALDRSKCLIVLCSPQAAQSRYVSEEIAYFKRIGNSDRIIAAIIDGEPNVSWDAKKRDAGFAAERECFPFALMHPIEADGRPDEGVWVEPIAADLRLPDGKQGWVSARNYRKTNERDGAHTPDVITRQAAVQEQILAAGLRKIVAGVLGIPNRDYEAGEEAFRAEKDRRRVRTLTAWLAAVFVLAVCAVGAAIFGWVKEKEAMRQKNEADCQRKIAEKQAQIAEQSLNSLTGMFESINPAHAKLHEVTVREIMDQKAKTLSDECVDPEVELPLRRSMGIIYSKLGLPYEALGQTEIARQLAKTIAGNTNSVVLADILNQEAFFLEAVARYDDALQKFDQALEMLKVCYKTDHVDMAFVMENIAKCLEHSGRASEGLIKYREAVAMCKRLGNISQSDLARLLANEANCLHTLGRTGEALLQLEYALKVYKEVYDGDNPDVALGMNNVALYLNELGRTDDALVQFQETIAMQKRIYPGDHPDILTSINNIGLCLQRLGKLKEARTQFENALTSAKKIYQGDHPMVLRLMNNLASCLQSLGDVQEAFELFDKSQDMMQRLYSSTHPEIAVGINNITQCLLQMNRPEDALAKCERALEICRRAFTNDHPNQAIILNNEAACLNIMGRYSEALPKLKESLAMQKRLYAGDHPDIALNLNNTAACLDSLGRQEEAQNMYEQSLAMRTRLFDRKHPDIAQSLNNIGCCLMMRGKYSEAVPKLKEALDIQQAIIGYDHINSMRSLHNLAICYLKVGDHLNAYHYFKESANMNSRLKRREDPAVWQYLVCVESVGNGTPAKVAGIKEGDVFVAYDGTMVFDSMQFSELTDRAVAAGKAHVIAEVLRGGKLKDIEIPAGKLDVELGCRWLTRQEAGEATDKVDEEGR